MRAAYVTISALLVYSQLASAASIESLARLASFCVSGVQKTVMRPPEERRALPAEETQAHAASTVPTRSEPRVVLEDIHFSEAHAEKVREILLKPAAGLSEEEQHALVAHGRVLRPARLLQLASTVLSQAHKNKRVEYHHKLFALRLIDNWSQLLHSSSPRAEQHTADLIDLFTEHLDYFPSQMHRREILSHLSKAVRSDPKSAQHFLLALTRLKDPSTLFGSEDWLVQALADLPVPVITRAPWSRSQLRQLLSWYDGRIRDQLSPGPQGLLSSMGVSVRRSGAFRDLGHAEMAALYAGYRYETLAALHTLQPRLVDPGVLQFYKLELNKIQAVLEHYRLHDTIRRAAALR